jgi:hypothetical protein
MKEFILYLILISAIVVVVVVVLGKKGKMKTSVGRF